MECATRLSGVGIDAGARVPAASAPVVADVCCGPFLSVASSANTSADAHIGVARVGVVPQDSAVSSVSDVSVGVCVVLVCQAHTYYWVRMLIQHV